MKDKILSFILSLIIVAIIVVGGIFGYTAFVEITGEDPIQINFEGYGGLLSKDDKDTEDTISVDKDIFNGIESNENSAQSIVTNTNRYRHLYGQLNSTAQKIYDKLYENKENLKTGTYKIEFGNTFQKLLTSDGGEKELKKQYQSAIEALIYENPELFYVEATGMFINIEKITKISGVKYNYLTKGFNGKDDIDSYQVQIEKVRDYILSNLNERTDYEKIKLVHDYLVDSIEYDSSISKDHIYDIYGALVSRECVCEGYAKAFQYLMNEVGIDNVIVIGTGTNSNGQTESHAWNYVKLDNKWYAVDVTWDDPILIGTGKLPEKSKYKYFLKGSITMNENHTPSGKFTDAGQVFTYPVLSEQDYE